MSADTSKRTGWAGWPFMTQPAVVSDLPELCQCGGLHSRICELGTKGCTCQHEHPGVEAGTVDLEHPASCVGCGCTDSQGCAEGCSWLAVNRASRSGVCSNCASHLDAWKASQP